VPKHLNRLVLRLQVLAPILEQGIFAEFEGIGVPRIGLCSYRTLLREERLGTSLGPAARPTRCWKSQSALLNLEWIVSTESKQFDYSPRSPYTLDAVEASMYLEYSSYMYVDRILSQ
jgi:hypothetical protein